MAQIKSLLRRFKSDENGAAMLEYTILIGLVTVAAIGAIVFAGGWVSEKWTALQTTLTGK